MLYVFDMSDLASYFEVVPHLVVAVSPAYRPGRWAWHLVDRRDGREFESEFEYQSAAEAHRAGATRLAELAAALLGPDSAGDAAQTAVYRKAA
jgi:hypothetical protein